MQLRQKKGLHHDENDFDRELNAMANRYKLDKDMTEQQRIAITAAIGLSRTYSTPHRKTYDLLDKVIGNQFGHGFPAGKLERQKYLLSTWIFLVQSRLDHIVNTIRTLNNQTS